MDEYSSIFSLIGLCFPFSFPNSCNSCSSVALNPTFCKLRTCWFGTAPGKMSSSGSACKSIIVLLAVNACQGAVDLFNESSALSCCLGHVFLFCFLSCFDKMKSPGASTQRAAPRCSCCWFSPLVELPPSTCSYENPDNKQV